MEAEKWWEVDCSACGEMTLSPAGSGPCPWCGEEGQATFTPDDQPRAVAAQEAVVEALWELGRCGDPYDAAGRVRPEFLNGVGVAKEKILSAFGYVVTPHSVRSKSEMTAEEARDHLQRRARELGGREAYADLCDCRAAHPYLVMLDEGSAPIIAALKAEGFVLLPEGPPEEDGLQRWECDGWKGAVGPEEGVGVMTIEERLNEQLNEREAEISRLCAQIEGLENKLDAISNGWRVGEVLPGEQALPVPRLEIVWQTRHGDWVECEAAYRLVYRHFLGHIVTLPIGLTRRSGGPGDRPVRGGVVETPYREGSHIRHDAAHLGLPAFAICEGTVTPLEWDERFGENHAGREGKPGMPW